MFSSVEPLFKEGGRWPRIFRREAEILGIFSFEVAPKCLFQKPLTDIKEIVPMTTLIREGTAGDTFYILAAGEVRVTRGQGETIRELTIGDYFGEQALLKTDVRTANVIAQTAVECLTLDRE